MMMTAKKRAWMCAVGCIILVACANSTSTILNLFLTSICERLNCTPTQVSYIFTFSSLSGIIVSFIGSTSLVKYSPKWQCALSGCFILSLFIGCAYSSSIYFLWVLGFMYGIGIKICGSLLYQIYIGGWFKTGATFLMSLCMSVSTGVSAVLSPVCAKMISSLGFASTALYFGIGFGVIIILASLFLLSKLPDAYDMRPIEVNLGKKSQNAPKNVQEESIIVPTNELFKKTSFYITMAVPLVICFYLTMYFYNVSYVYISKGLDLMSASYCISISMAAGVVLNLLFGVLSEKIGSGKSFVIYFGIGLVVMVLSIFVNGWVGSILLALLVNVAQCSVMYVAIYSRSLFGSQASAKMIGWYSAISSAVSMLSAPVGTILASIGHGQYTYMFMLFALFYVVAILGTIYLNRKQITR